MLIQKIKKLIRILRLLIFFIKIYFNKVLLKIEIYIENQILRFKKLNDKINEDLSKAFKSISFWVFFIISFYITYTILFGNPPW
jgi:hypothetical protein